MAEAKRERCARFALEDAELRRLLELLSPAFERAAALSDRRDQTAFDPDYDTLPLAEFEPLVREFFSSIPTRKLRTASDCVAER